MADDKSRVRVRLPDDVFAQLQYWSNKKGLSLNEYIIEAVELAIRHENKDYDLPSLEIARLNQIVEMVLSLQSDLDSTTKVIVSGFDTLTGLTRGDNYLLENEDGEI